MRLIEFSIYIYISQLEIKHLDKAIIPHPDVEVILPCAGYIEYSGWTIIGIIGPPPGIVPNIANFIAAASAVDVVDGTLTVTNDAPAVFPMGATVVTFSATDSAGNSASDTATVTINDAGAPALTTPADVTVNSVHEAMIW